MQITLIRGESNLLLFGMILRKPLYCYKKKNNDKVKFQWQNDEEDDEDYYFEFKIQVDEITKDVSLIVTDFAEEDELEESKMLWDNLVSDLKQVLGAS